jgi:tetratricopeptide (TPR) repeat protein
MHRWVRSLILLALTLMAAPSWSVVEAPAPSTPGAAQSDEDKIKAAYNDGLGLSEKADQAAAAGDGAGARQSYEEANRTFQELAKLAPDMPAAWNMVGYTERKLGNYQAALDAYGRALTLRPNYAEAISYRGEAYLGLNRLPEAKQAYLDLFAVNRILSEQYLDAMETWIAARRKDAAGVSPAALKELDKWVREREKIAAKTAALTREGAAASWR